MVSVIVTTYKRKPEMVVRAVESVCRQTYPELEIFVVDDSPSDYEYRDDVMQALLNIGDDRIIYLRNEKNMGACASRNRAIKQSKGDFIMYVDDDDELTTDSVEKKLCKFDNDKIGLVYSDCYVLEEEKNEKRRTNQQKHSGNVFDKLILHNFVYAFPMIRKKCFEECGMFDEYMPALQDYEMWLRIAKKYEFNYVDEPLAIVHLHEGERISKNPMRKINGMLRMNEKNREYLQNHRYANHVCIIHQVPYYAYANQKKTAWKKWFIAFAMAPFDIKINLQHLRPLLKNGRM